eukprot:CAMPEP_0114016560 /NCGR_PEP_ID=MMETSP0372-20130328/13774_1 /TAXON_ID=340204 /ORGANISM="Lankesteria abbotti" /LENGTH=45 /assembly_acc=CAM_ASM_000359
MKQEGMKFGTLVDVVIPRSTEAMQAGPGVGKVFLRYNDVTSARKA